MNPNDLKKLTEAVDLAFQALIRDPTPDNEAAYDLAYQRWKSLGVDRGVGRPASGDQAGLTSTERSQAARARQQQSATRWEKVAPYIQHLRRAIDGGDGAEITRIAQSLVKETEMLLSNLQVVHAQPDSDFVVLNGFDGKKMVLAFIPTQHLDDHFERRHLTGKQANLVVDRNLEAFARIISAKYERGEHRPYSRFGSTLPRVDLNLEDIKSSGEEMSDSVLDMRFGWVGQDGSVHHPE